MFLNFIKKRFKILYLFSSFLISFQRNFKFREVVLYANFPTNSINKNLIVF